MQKNELKSPRLLIDMADFNIACHYAGARFTSDMEQAEATILSMVARLRVLIRYYETLDLHFCWDGEGSIRSELYPPYRGIESASKPEFLGCLAFADTIKKVLAEMGFYRQYQIAKVEASDIIGELSKQEHDGDTVIIAKNMSLLSLLADMVHFQTIKSTLDGSRPVLFLKRDLEAQFDITPEQWRWVRAIGGDPWKNIKGVRGATLHQAVKYLRGEARPTVEALIESKMADVELFLRIFTYPIIPLNAIMPTPPANQFNIDGLVAVCSRYNLIKEMKNGLWNKLAEGRIQ